MGHQYLEGSLKEIMADYLHILCDEEEVNDVIKFWDAKCELQPLISSGCMACEMLHLRHVSLGKK